MRPGRTLAELDPELTPAQRYEIYRQLGAVLQRLHAIPASGYGDCRAGGRISSPLPDNSAYMAHLLDRDRMRLRLYRIALALELHSWFTISGQAGELPALHRELRQLAVGPL